MTYVFGNFELQCIGYVSEQYLLYLQCEILLNQT